MKPRELDEHDAAAQIRAIRMLQEAYQCDLTVEVWRTIGGLIADENLPWDDPKWFEMGPRGWPSRMSRALYEFTHYGRDDPAVILRLIALLTFKWFDIHRRQPCSTTGEPDAQPKTP